MKQRTFRVVTMAVSIVGLSGALLSAVQAQDIGTQEYVNRRINEMTMNRAILHQATQGHHKAMGHSGTRRTHRTHRIAHHTTRRHH